MPVSFKKFLDESIQIINYIKSRPLKSRLFTILCEDMGSLHRSLLLHTEVRKSETKVTAIDKVRALKRKINFWVESVEEGEVECFPFLKEVLKYKTLALGKNLFHQILEHLQSLMSLLEHHFPTAEDEKLYSYFWICLDNKKYYPLVEKAKRVLLPFATTYTCESGFSIYTARKTKYRSCLDAEPDICLQLSRIEPNFSKLCQQKHPQPHIRILLLFLQTHL
ncbi:zinc finger BED domain-containing protein 5-like [Schistocerca americana]|uniref:zinc finger BED domain-containing protein 5-like n=1 Tax=Schistocerca americana TaxID=7009 RepID=UPI001F4FF692|nr:zinc finger BED domain-containing protein 5-like [Schistocerca americana]